MEDLAKGLMGLKDFFQRHWVFIAIGVSALILAIGRAYGRKRREEEAQMKAEIEVLREQNAELRRQQTELERHFSQLTRERLVRLSRRQNESFDYQARAENSQSTDGLPTATKRSGSVELERSIESRRRAPPSSIVLSSPSPLQGTRREEPGPYLNLSIDRSDIELPLGLHEGQDVPVSWLADVNGGAARLYRVAFACDRQFEGSGSNIKFNATPGELVLGQVTVSVPENRRLGELTQPRWYLLQLTPDPNKHFILRSTELQTSDHFFRDIKNVDSRMQDKAFIFVHGYNVTFEDAALRTAQMAADLNIEAIPVFFSWASQGKTALYTIDEQNARLAEPDLKLFLEQFADNTEVSKVFVIAHSMGARIATASLAQLLRDRPDLKGRFGELILAAPDIDAREFVRTVVPGLSALHQKMTLYSSSKDKALAASKAVHGYARAGDSDPQVLVISGVETVDASNIDTDLLGHSYIVHARPLLTDVALLLGASMRADKRPTLRQFNENGMMHWNFRA